MADSDSTLDILIKLGVIGQDDVKAARDLLSQTGAAAKETGKAADYLNPAMVTSGKTMGEAAGEAKNLFENHRLLHAALHQTGAEIPGLSALLHGLFNPATLGLVAGMTAIQAYFEHLSKVQEKQLEWIQELQKTNDALHEITSTGKSAEEQLIDINKALADGEVKAHGLSHSIDLMTQSWAEYQENVKNAAAAQQQADEDAATGLKSRIDLLEKAGVVSKETADALRAEAVYEAELAKVQAERAAKENQYQELQRQQGDAIRQRNALPTDADAQKKLANDQEALTRNEAILTRIPRILSDLKNQYEEASRRGDIDTMHQIQDNISRDQNLLDKAKAQNPDLEKQVSQDKDTIAAIGKLNTTIDGLTGQMNTLNQSIIAFNKSSQAHMDQVATDRNRTEFGGGAADMLKQAEEIARRYQQVQQGKLSPNAVSQQELNELIRVSEAATGRSQNAKSAMGTMLAASKNIHVAMDDLDRLVGVMEQIAYTLPNNLSISRRLSEIERRLSGMRGSNTNQ